MLIIVQDQLNDTESSKVRPFLCLMKMSSQDLPAEEAAVSAHTHGERLQYPT